VPPDREVIHLAVLAVNVTTSRATDVRATRGLTTSAATATDGPVPMLAPVVMANRTVTLARRARVAMAVPRARGREVRSATSRMTGNVGPVRHVTVATVLPTPDAPRDLTEKNVRLDHLEVRVLAGDLLLDSPVVTHAMDVKPAPTPTDDPVRRRAGREADRAIGPALRRAGGDLPAPRANSLQTR